MPGGLAGRGAACCQPAVDDNLCVPAPIPRCSGHYARQWNSAPSRSGHLLKSDLPRATLGAGSDRGSLACWLASRLRVMWSLRTSSWKSSGWSRGWCARPALAQAVTSITFQFHGRKLRRIARTMRWNWKVTGRSRALSQAGRDPRPHEHADAPPRQRLAAGRQDRSVPRTPRRRATSRTAPPPGDGRRRGYRGLPPPSEGGAAGPHDHGRSTGRPVSRHQRAATRTRLTVVSAAPAAGPSPAGPPPAPASRRSPGPAHGTLSDHRDQRPAPHPRPRPHRRRAPDILKRLETGH